MDSRLALSAAKVGVEHKLPHADSIIFATAQQCDATIWTMDADFVGMPRVRYYPKGR